jgi:hypothetical protein
VFVDLQGRDRAVVDVSEKEDVNWTIPVTGKLIPRDWIEYAC